MIRALTVCIAILTMSGCADHRWTADMRSHSHESASCEVGEDLTTASPGRLANLGEGKAEIVCEMLAP